MPNQNIDPIIKKYFDLIAPLKVFKTFYYGDPIRIPQSNLPALIGTRRNTRTSWGDSQNDQHDMQLVFTVVVDVRKEISDDATLIPGWGTLYDLMEGRDPSTLLLKPNTLLYILRHNFAVANNLWTDMKTATGIEYGLVAGKRQVGQWSIEAALTTTCSLVQLR